MKELRKRVLLLVANNDIEKAIKELLTTLENHPNQDAYERTVFLSAKFENFEEKVSKNLLTSEARSVEESVINNDLLNILDVLEETPETEKPVVIVEPVLENEIVPKKKTIPLKRKTPLYQFAILGMFIGLTMVLGAWVVFGGDEDKSPETTEEVRPEISEREERRPRPAPETDRHAVGPKTFRIIPKSIQAFDVRDGMSKELEVYGLVKMGIRKKGEAEKANTVFVARRDQPLAMSEGRKYKVNNQTRPPVEVELKPVNGKYALSEYEFVMYAGLTEKDEGSNTDDAFGNKRVVLPFKNLGINSSDEFKLKLESDDGTLMITAVVESR